ncbi:MAG: hypothetical protein V8R94_01605 [Lachnospiraceae bacterium]
MEKELRDRSFYLLFRMGFLLRRGIGGSRDSGYQTGREKLEHRGIHVMAAAIGEDRELIRRIYGKGFLNISDTERIPAAMAGIIRQYMGK